MTAQITVPASVRSPHSSPSSDKLLTLDQLTERVGVSVRNIRFYTTRGLLPGPIRRGRSGYYTDEHVARLELVKELQAHGLTLAAIERYLARIPADAAPEEIALHRVTLQPWLVEQPETVSRRELAARAQRPVTDELLGKLAALRVVRRVGRGYEVVPSRLSAALRLIDLDIPVELLTRFQEIYQRHGKAIADELGSLFRASIWPAYKDGSVSTEHMVRMLENFQPVSIAALVEAFSQAMTDARRAELTRRTR